MIDFLPPPVEDAKTTPARTDVSPDASPEVRVLTEAEVSALGPLFEQYGGHVPDPRWSFVVGAVDPQTSKILGFLVTQLVMHSQPLYIQPGHEHLLSRLVGMTEDTILARVGPSTVYTFVPAGKVARMAALFGMRAEPWIVMSREVVPEPQPEPTEPQPEPTEPVRNLREPQEPGEDSELECDTHPAQNEPADVQEYAGVIQ